jgi:hypothetical protein
MKILTSRFLYYKITDNTDLRTTAINIQYNLVSIRHINMLPKEFKSLTRPKEYPKASGYLEHSEYLNIIHSDVFL